MLPSSYPSRSHQRQPDEKYKYSPSTARCTGSLPTMPSRGLSSNGAMVLLVIAGLYSIAQLNSINRRVGRIAANLDFLASIEISRQQAVAETTERPASSLQVSPAVVAESVPDIATSLKQSELPSDSVQVARRSAQSGASVKSPSAASTAKKQGKPADPYVWPKPLPEWALVPASEANEAPLPGEGLLSEKLQNLPRSGRGVLFNAIHRDPAAPRASKPINEAINGAKRMKEALAERGGASTMKFCLVTEKAPFAFMSNPELCKDMWPECIGFADKIKIFDSILFYEDFDMPPVVERREKFQTWPELWEKRIFASLNSPFSETMVVDSDVYACTKFEDLFDEYLQEADLAITLAPAPFGSARNYAGAFRPGFSEAYANYTERNLGLQLLATGEPKVQKLLAIFRDAYIRQANNTEHVSIGNDQCAFREALWTMKKTAGLVENIIPNEIGCRHETGCADGCLAVHRHSNPEMSKAQLQELKAAKLAERRAQQAAKKAAENGELN